MKIIKIIKDKINRISKIYEGSLYQVKDDSKLLTKKNVENKSDKIIETIYYKRPLFSNMYVKEISTGRKIPTFVKNKVFRLPFKKYIIVEEKGYKFKEPEIKKTDIKESYNLNKELNSLFKIEFTINIKKKKKKTKTKKCVKKNNGNGFVTNFKKVLLKSKLLKNKIIKYFNKNTKKAKESFKNDPNIEVANFSDDNFKIDSPIINLKKATTKNKPEIIDVDNYEIIHEAKKGETNVQKINNMEKIKSDITNLKKIKREMICDYWATKKYPKKEIIELGTDDSEIENLIKLITKKSNEDNIVKAKFNNITLSTQILKTEKELLAYYYYKVTGNKDVFTEDIKENCYRMLRADRKLKR